MNDPAAIFEGIIPIDGKAYAPEECMYQVVHHELVASALVVKKGHGINPDFIIGCMMARVPLYPYSYRPDDMMYSVLAMHDRYLFGDVHVRDDRR